MAADQCHPDGTPINKDLEDLAGKPDSMGTGRPRVDNGQAPVGEDWNLFDEKVLETQAAFRKRNQELRRERHEMATEARPGLAQLFGFPAGPMFHEIQSRLPAVKVFDWFRNLERSVDRIDVNVQPFMEEARELFAGLRRQKGSQSKILSNLSERQNVQRLFEARQMVRTGDVTKAQFETLTAQFGPVIAKAAGEYENLWRRFLTHLGHDEQAIDTFLMNFPTLRKRGDVSSDFVRKVVAAEALGEAPPQTSSRYSTQGGLTKMRGRGSLYPDADHVRSQGNRIKDSLNPDIKMGTLMMADYEYDGYRIAQAVMRKLGEVEYMLPQWNQIVDEFTAAKKAGIIDDDIAETFMRYARVTRHIPDTTQVAMARQMRVMDNFLSKASGGLYKGQDNDDMFFGLTQSLLGVNYWANMAFNPGIALRNFSQPFMTSYPVIGEVAMGKGIAWAARSQELVGDEFGGLYKGLTRKEASYQMGLISQTHTPKQAVAMREGMQAMRMGGSPALQSIVRGTSKAGWAMFHSSESYVRMTAFFGAFKNAEKASAKYFKSARDADARKAWLSDSGVGLMNPTGSPLTQKWLNLLDLSVEGKTTAKTARDVAMEIGKHHTEQANFIYRRGNGSYALNHSVGRFLGQYGTWPSWYAHSIKRLVRYGDRMDRIKAVGRAVAVNNALIAGGASIFGIDMGNWAGFSPLEYTGGPMTELITGAHAQASEVLSEVTGSRRDPVDAIQASRWRRRGWEQITPIVPVRQVRNSIDAYRALAANDYSLALKEFTGFPSSEGE
jgi:hypothetical protein